MPSCTSEITSSNRITERSFTVVALILLRKKRTTNAREGVSTVWKINQLHHTGNLYDSRINFWHQQKARELMANDIAVTLCGHSWDRIENLCYRGVVTNNICGGTRPAACTTLTLIVDQSKHSLWQKISFWEIKPCRMRKYASCFLISQS